MLDDPRPKPSMPNSSGKANATLIQVGIAKTGTGPRPNEVQCSVTAKPGSTPYVKADGTIDLPKDTGPYQIEFEITDALDWKLDNPFDTQKGNCPPNGKHNCDDQIWLQWPQGKTLTILNMNQDASCKIHYRMNFSNGTWCDPIMNNGGRT